MVDVHGAGAQRSDPKTGDPADYPYGHGPQGDVIRIYNYVRLVRNADIKTSVGENNKTSVPNGFVLNQNYPNPFNPETLISYQIQTAGNVQLEVFDVLGKKISTLVNKYQQPGIYSITFNTSKYSIPSGIYFYRIQSGSFVESKKMILLK